MEKTFEPWSIRRDNSETRDDVIKSTVLVVERQLEVLMWEMSLILLTDITVDMVLV